MAMDNSLNSSQQQPRHSREWEADMFRLLVENVKDYAIFIIDEQRRIQSWSAGAERILGYSEAEIMGERLDCFFTPEDLAAGEPEREIRTALATGRGEDDRWHLRRNGTRFWCSGVTTPLRDASGAFRGFAKIMRDLTQQKYYEDKLVASEARYRHFLKSNILGAGISHADGRILKANEEYLRIVGYSEQELNAGRAWWSKATPAEYLPLDQAAIAEAVRNGSCTPYEKEYVRHSDGRRIPVQIAFTTVPETADEFIVYVIDLTARKQIEEELRAANRSKDEFLAMLGHELRNPLAPMFNAVHILRNAKRSEDEALARQSLNMIERQVRHMTRLVDDLLEVARITMGKVDLQPDEVELHPIVNSAVEATKPAMVNRRHQLHLDIAKEPIWLKADAVRIEQMLTNLLNNASKYTEPGGIISLRASREDSTVVIRVTDNGIGIDAATLPRIFEPFVQVDTAHGYSRGGLGVGLTLVRRFAELHGGSVSAFSAGLGTGSEFTVKLPVVDAATNDRRGPNPQDVNRCAVRVMVVDDNSDAAESLRMLLEIVGHQVLVAHSGPAAVQEAAAWKPEIVLLDIGLPGLDGYQVAEILRRAPATEGVTIVAMTGFGQEGDIARARAAGFDHHMVKPVDPDRLLKLLDDVAEKLQR